MPRPLELNEDRLFPMETGVRTIARELYGEAKSLAILSLPDLIRGYGPIKEKSVQDAKAHYAELARQLADPAPIPVPQAAE